MQHKVDCPWQYAYSALLCRWCAKAEGTDLDADNVTNDNDNDHDHDNDE